MLHVLLKKHADHVPVGEADLAAQSAVAAKEHPRQPFRMQMIKKLDHLHAEKQSPRQTINKEASRYPCDLQKWAESIEIPT
jgi:hypothetical protein